MPGKYVTPELSKTNVYSMMNTNWQDRDMRERLWKWGSRNIARPLVEAIKADDKEAMEFFGDKPWNEGDVQKIFTLLPVDKFKVFLDLLRLNINDLVLVYSKKQHHILASVYLRNYQDDFTPTFHAPTKMLCNQLMIRAVNNEARRILYELGSRRFALPMAKAAIYRDMRALQFFFGVGKRPLVKKVDILTFNKASIMLQRNLPATSDAINTLYVCMDLYIKCKLSN